MNHHHSTMYHDGSPSGTASETAMDAGAEAGPETLFHLGLRYCTGHEVSRNLVEAHKWFNLAAMSGDLRAREYRREISHEMSPAEIAEAQRQARNWLKSY
jgi:uncharacterized protein